MSDDNKEESFINHLEALRQTIIKCLISLCFSFPIGIILAPKSLNMLTKHLIGGNKLQFNYFSPMEIL